jgi:predicted regulator of Ras-like GTPase activity (Roadblock/LC7/MglB family)
MDETVMSGFFSAFFTFTQSLCGADIQDIELGPYRIIFEVVGKHLILTVIFDKADSVINVIQRLVKLKEVLLTEYQDAIKKNFCNSEDFEGLHDRIVNTLAKPLFVSLNEEIKSRYLKILNELRSNNEILDCALISINGVPLLKETKKEFLDLIIKQMDAFWKFKSQVLDQIILYYENRYIILYKVDEDLVLSVFLRKDTPIGLATLLVEESASKIARVRLLR